MTGEEKQQVQNIINARMKLLNEKASRQEAEIKTLKSQLEEKTAEIDELKTQLTKAQEQSKKLIAMIHQNQKLEPEKKTEPVKPKVNYLVSLLRQHFNYDSFRPGQEEVINAILSGRDVFCSMPDDYGKSLCAKLPAMLMPGLTLVITPNIPDKSMSESHLHSICLLPDMSPTKKRSIMRDIKNGTYKIVYAALNELKDSEIVNVLRSVEISMSAIILQWGQPDRLKESKALIASLSTKRIPTAIFANSTSPLMRQECMRSLVSPLRIITGFNRPNVTFRIIRAEKKISALNEILAQKKDLPGVIYCSNPESAYKIRENLRDYPGLDEKIIIMPGALYREIKRRDIRFIVHYELPGNLASYSQEINCAGIDGSSSECIMLVSRKDFSTAEKSVIKFCEEKNQKDALMLYLGIEDKSDNEENKSSGESEKISSDEFADFDFGTSNEAQKEAITSSNGPVLIIAGPGTGKTYTLVQRTVFLIQKRHVKPENIMLATFTNKAASELSARITEELASRKIPADISSMYTGTFHEICGRILKEYSDFTRLKRNFRVLDDFDNAYIIMQNFSKFMAIDGIDSALKSFNQGKWKMSSELRDMISKLSEELADPEELSRDSDIAISFMGNAMKVFDSILAEDNSMSYSSMLVETYKLLRDNPEILADIHDKVHYIMVDEYQDTNYIQEQLIFMIAGDRKNICVVGDDDQSLYRFRGAEVRNILEFPDKFGKNECKIVKLMLNYRSLDGIVKFFTEWMNNTENFFSWDNFRHDKNLESYRKGNNTSVMRLAGLNDPDEWHEKILNFIKHLKDSGRINDYNQIAFLFKSVKINRVQSLIQYLESNNINVYSPRSEMFFDRGEIKFAIGCLISMFPKYLTALNSGEFKFNGIEPGYITYYRECLMNVNRFINRTIYADLKKWLLDKRSYHEKLQGYTNYTYSDILYQMFAFPPFRKVLDEDINNGVKATRPARNLAKLIEVIQKYENSHNVNNINAKYMDNQFQMMMNIHMRFQYEEGVDEYESDNSSEIPAGHVSFMTIHQSKGMEFPIVFVDSLWSYPNKKINPNMNEEIMHKIERKYYKRPEFEPEEQIKFFDFWRLFYVAFSRAQDLLILTCNEEPNNPSRYFVKRYNVLEDADESFNASSSEISPLKNSGAKNIFSFTQDILLYETCPMQYKFFRELEFQPDISNHTLMGLLVHATIEDIHKAAEKHEEAKITEENILRWFNANYETLSRTNRAYLTKAARDT
ncbi:MAG: UvrD-helicase domain-containing protein, partial [Synergistaceae bacterium]|nr:UvrD-helicase domain-containing protein [Synergistaceae bacterium]